MPTAQFPFAQSVLVDLDLDKVALCNQGANSRAHILLTKRKENVNMPKTFEELMAAIETSHSDVIKAHIATLEKAKDDAIAALNLDVENLTKEVETLQETVKTAKSVKAEENTQEDILKSASPEVAKYISDLQKSVSTLVADKEEAIAKTRFEEVKAIPVEEEVLKSVLKSASPAVFEVLKKAAAAVETAVLTAKGKETTEDTFRIDADAAYDKLEKTAKEIVGKNASLTFEQAFTEACIADPATYAKYTMKGAN